MALIFGVLQRTACQLKASEESLRLSVGEADRLAGAE
jgi:hypothetical protein